jgi:uncharacterized membrane protein
MVVRHERARMSDQEVDEVIGALLRYGVIIAAVTVAIGGVWYLIKYGTRMPDYRVFRAEPNSLRSLHGIVRGISGFHSVSVIQFGVVMLIATPVARVAFSVLAFLLQGDRKYVAITVVVLSVLLFSLLGKH